MPRSSAAQTVALNESTVLRLATPRRDVTDLHRTYAPCRALGHEWHHVGAEPAYDGAMIGLRSECGHCRMGRLVFVTHAGYRSPRVHPRYYPPPEYADRGDDRFDRGEWTQLVLAEMLPARRTRRRRR